MSLLKRWALLFTFTSLIQIIHFNGIYGSFPGTDKSNIAVAPRAIKSAIDSERIEYMNTKDPACTAPLTTNLVELYGRNRNIYEECVRDANGYSLFPYSGQLPSDGEIKAIVSSAYCILFLQGVLLLPDIRECNLGGIGIVATVETLLMTSQDVLASNSSVLTSTDLELFIDWRFDRNLRKEANLKYDNSSESAIIYESQLEESKKRWEITLSDDLIIFEGGLSVGSSDSPIISETIVGKVNSVDDNSEFGSASDADVADTTSSSSSASLRAQSWKHKSIFVYQLLSLVICVVIASGIIL